MKSVLPGMVFAVTLALAGCTTKNQALAQSRGSFIAGQQQGFAQAQVQGLVKPLEAKLLMELVFGAFTGMMRAHWEGRITLDESAIARAEAACWDMLALPAEARG